MSIRLGQNEVQEYLNITTYEGNVDLNNYYTKEEVDEKIPSLDGYITEDSLTDYATEVYVDTKLSNLVNAAPETLDTLGELAEAITENESVINGLNAAIANKANKTDLNSYATQEWVEDKLQDIDIGDINLDEYAKKTDLFSKNYNDLNNKPDLSKLEEIKTYETDIVFSTASIEGAAPLRSIVVDKNAYNIVGSGTTGESAAITEWREIGWLNVSKDVETRDLSKLTITNDSIELTNGTNNGQTLNGTITVDDSKIMYTENSKEYIIRKIRYDGAFTNFISADPAGGFTREISLDAYTLNTNHLWPHGDDWRTRCIVERNEFPFYSKSRITRPDDPYYFQLELCINFVDKLFETSIITDMVADQYSYFTLLKISFLLEEV